MEESTFPQNPRTIRGKTSALPRILEPHTICSHLLLLTSLANKKFGLDAPCLAAREPGPKDFLIKESAAGKPSVLPWILGAHRILSQLLLLVSLIIKRFRLD